MTEASLRRYTTLASAVDMLVNERLALLNPFAWKDTNDTHFLAAFQECVKAKSVYAACFTQAQETYHHWRVFAGENEGVCIHLDKTALLNHLNSSKSYIYDDIKYRSLYQIERRKSINAYELPFLKRKGFLDEKEFRLLYKSNKSQASVHYVQIKRSWIKRIVVNPWISETLFDSMKVALNSIPKSSRVKIFPSTLINNWQWKNACEKVSELAG